MTSRVCGRMRKISDETQQMVNAWLSVDWDPESREHVKGLVAAGKEEELVAHLGRRISFGTAGLRGKMKWGFAFMNAVTVTQASQGLCAYLRTVHPCLTDLRERGVIVGHDGRYNSRMFARLTAAVFLSRKIKVHLFRDDVPTPLVAFAVRHLKCAAGVMVTASHNPKEDNGYKVYWANSAQITAPHDAQIARAIEANFSIWDRMPDDKAIDEHPLCLDPTTDVCAAYLAAARHWSFRTPQQNAAAQLRVVYTAMHGVGGQSVERIFDAFGLPPVIAVREQHDPDPDFTTVEFPNPEEANGCSLRLAMATADREGAPLILANDPDADRLAVAERQRDSGEWRILDGNEIALLLADWLWRNYTERHPEVDRSKIVMLNSTVSSKALAAMAAKEGFLYRETLTGFKWLGNLADELVRAGYTFLFAYEVEIGFMIGDMSLDTDGVRTAPVFVEMANHLYERGLTLSDHLDNLYHKYGYYKMAVGYYFCHDPRLMDQIFNEIRNDGLYISTCGDHKVQYVRDLTTGFDNSQPHNRAVLPVSSAAHMITFTFENECVATFRGSGTEPKLKYYIEVANASNEQLATDLLDSMKQEIIDRFLQPSQNGLRPPAAAEDAHNSPHNSGNSPEQMAPARIARDVIQKEIQALQNLEATLGRDFEKVVEIIESRGSGRVIFTGVGKSGIIAQKISASFSSLGISSFFVHATEAAHGDLGVITAEDVVIAISNSGNTPELIFIIPSLRVLAGKIIGITSNKDSLLARYSDASIITGKIVEADQHKIAPTASTIVCLAIGDALAVTLSARMKFTLPEFGLRHPGGVLGEKVLGKVFQEFAMKGQGRFLRFWKRMTNEERDKLRRDFERIDLAELSRIYLQCRSKAEKGAIDPHSLEPLPSHTWVKLHESDPAAVAAWRDAGLRALREGKIAVVLMAGGQATRLGMTMPKGFLDLNLPSHKSLYQLHAEKLLRLQDDVRQTFAGGDGDEVVQQQQQQQIQIPFYVMTSPEALQQTHQFFIKHQFFGLCPKQVFFFKQRSLPCVAPSGEIIMDTKCSVVFSPDGHGGLFVALKDAKAYEDMKRRGVEYVFAFGVDNPLCEVADPAYMGYCIQRNVKMGYKVVDRRDPQETAGVVCVRDGVINCVEYSELPESVAELRDEQSGELVYNAANMLNLFFTLRFMRKIADNPSLMEYHLAKKRIPFVNDNGVRTEPLVPNGGKFEKYLVDCTPYANNSVAVMFVKREEEYAPIKNGWNSEVDSPRSARRLLAAHYRRRIERAGGKLAADDPDKLVEVSPLVTDRKLAQLLKDKHLIVTGPAILQ